MSVEPTITSNLSFEREAKDIRSPDISKVLLFDEKLKSNTPEIKIEKNISYGIDETKIMDIYQPKSKTAGKIPVVLFLVGGEEPKDHPSMKALGQGFAENGIAMISPEYGDLYSGKMKDIESILRYIKDHAEENNWDLDNITLAGGSAGAHAAMQYAMNPEFYSKTSGEIRIRNVIGYAPPTNYHLDEYPETYEESSSVMLGINNSNDIAANNRVRDEASPITYAGNEDIHNKRFFLTYGDDDPITTLKDQVDPFITEMISGEQNLTLDKPHPNGGHGHWLLPNSIAYDPNFVGRMSDWIFDKPVDTSSKKSTILDRGEGLESGIAYLDRQLKKGEDISATLDTILYKFENSDGVMTYLNHLKATNPVAADKYINHLESQVSNSVVEVFDAEYYAMNNPDLKENGVETNNELKEHWLIYGINEGRQGSADADYKLYLKNNADSIPEGIDTQIEALQYYNQYGQYQ